ncbi:MAG: hypothetical protein HQL96_00105 [Magnetococcales bacterium]|nr:hypothetical protein [Magnetococcales bacterium]
MSGGCRRAFVPIAGLYHACPERAGGFCVFNGIGAVIRSLRKEYDIRRVAYIDIDAHHGDGVFCHHGQGVGPWSSFGGWRRRI